MGVLRVIFECFWEENILCRAFRRIFFIFLMFFGSRIFGGSGVWGLGGLGFGGLGFKGLGVF